MWIKDIEGNFVNIETGSTIKNTCAIVFSPHPDDTRNYSILFDGTGDENKKYMTELQRELAQFGKLAKVKMALKCTCGNVGAVWEHDQICPVYAPF